MTVQPATRARRFDRGDRRTNVQLIERDLGMLMHVVRHRFLTAHHLARLVDGSEKKIIERCGQLFYAGFLDRPRAQLNYFTAGGGSQPIAYAIGEEGARALIIAGRIEDPGRLYWTRKNNEATKLYIRHTLEVADMAVALLADARPKPRVRVRLLDDLLPTFPADTRAAAKPSKWHVPVRFDGQSVSVGYVPDLLFDLAFDDGRHSAFLFEHDRGTMPIERSNLEQPSLMRKFLAVYYGHQQRQHEKRFAWKNFRHLTITNTRQRADNIRKFLAGHRVLAASNLFLITDQATFAAAPDVFLLPWLAPDGSSRRLTQDEYLGRHR